MVGLVRRLKGEFLEALAPYPANSVADESNASNFEYKNTPPRLKRWFRIDILGCGVQVGKYSVKSIIGSAQNI